MKQKSIKKNLLYNLIYQILVIIMPLITTPYIARVIGPKGSGIYSYTYSIASYFVLFAMLGIGNYGNRLIAQNRDDKNELSKSFSSLFFLHIIVTIIALIAYLVFTIFLSADKYKLFMFLQGIYVLSALFDINWLFFGLEEFKTTISRNIVIKIISVIFIFLFVRKPSDLIIYTLILNIGSLVSQLVLFPFLKRNGIRIVKFSVRDVIKHIKPMLVLFIPVIAVSIYKLMDKIMIGSLINVNEVGLYEYGERIINLPLSLITALGTVMLPRMSNLAAKGNDKLMKEYIDKSMKFVLLLSIPLAVGLIMISKDFIPFFLGEKYNGTIILVQLLAITIPIISFANVIRTQYLIPKCMDREYIISLMMGAFINLVLNYFLINKYHAMGACIATIAAEFVVMFYQIIVTRKMLNIRKHLEYLIKFLFISLFMALCLYLFNNVPINNSFIKISIKVVVGIIVYLFLSSKYINEFVSIKKMKTCLFRRKS